MALWRKRVRNSTLSSKQVLKNKKNNIVHSNSFYNDIKGCKRTDYMETSTNKRAANIFVSNN